MNVENLKKLALFLWDLPEEDATKRFDMLQFNTEHTNPHELLEDKNVCKTASCAIGWGPTAGIIPTPDDYNWGVYCINNLEDTGTKEWYWMFSSSWSPEGSHNLGYDNTPKGAAKRILWLLEGRPIPNCWSEGLYCDEVGRAMDDNLCDRESAIELYKDWIPDAIQSRDSLRVPVLDQNQPPEGGSQDQQNTSDPV